jgi:hypothetical protein
MLNRTNRTLSANLNRLNLGTRSLALGTGINNGAQSSRIRIHHTHRVVMRAGMVGFCWPRIPDSRPELPLILGSSCVPLWLCSGRTVRPWVELAAAVPASAPAGLVSCLASPVFARPDRPDLPENRKA